MPHRISFGTDGWRGIIADDFTFANVGLVAGAIADYVLDKGLADRRVVIGFDNRFMSERFAGLMAGVMSQLGIPVLIGKRSMPTPVTAFAVKHYKAAGAVMLTASHNPPEYNGIKFIPDYAGPALPETTGRIEAFIKRRLAGELPHTAAPAPARREEIDPSAAYIEHVRNLVDIEAIRRAGLKVVVDPLHGAGIGYLDRMLGDLDVEVTALHNHRDPLFGGSLPDPSAQKLSELRETVLAEGAHLGLGLDGDADRLGIIDSDGSFISPNQLLTLVYYHLLAVRGWRGPVARTVATTHLLNRISEAYGQETMETAVGFKYIGQCLLEKGSICGGEESGGLSIQGHVPEKDGILGGMLAAEIRAVHGKSLSALLDEIGERFGRVYCARIDLRTTSEHKPVVLETVQELAPDTLAGRPVRERITIDGTKLVLDDGAWVLIRASGTEPVFRIYTEANSPQQLQDIQSEIRLITGI
ncbi:MAG: phosphoglucomutase/phosphomannomutase family protein [Clostridia bacterium]|nr:phosphoglucomutase/phosphomannomutase family protein [Clostridia bacterium]MDQ7792167.1 phosphoglucomutase/phosphomannomutase family protein [Clostridia bacterium]